MAGLAATAAVAPKDLLKALPKTGRRKLRAVWTCESAPDYPAMHHPDAEKELMAIISKSIVEEIDRAIIEDLFGATKPMFRASLQKI